MLGDRVHRRAEDRHVQLDPCVSRVPTPTSEGTTALYRGSISTSSNVRPVVTNLEESLFIPYCCGRGRSVQGGAVSAGYLGIEMSDFCCGGFGVVGRRCSWFSVFVDFCTGGEFAQEAVTLEVAWPA